MKKLIWIGLLLSGALTAQTPSAPPSPEVALENVRSTGEKIDASEVRRWAVSQNGRIKPFDSLARETILFVTGKYNKLGLNPVQLYLAMASDEAAPYAPLIEVRDPKLRVKLGYLQNQRYFSVAELENSPLMDMARPAFSKQQEGNKLNEEERKITEAFNQLSVTRGIILGEHLAQAADFTFLSHNEAGGDHQAPGGPISAKVKEYIETLKSGDLAKAQSLSSEMVSVTRTQQAPELFHHYLDKLDLEILFHKIHPFFWAYVLSFLIGLFFILNLNKQPLSQGMTWLLIVLPLIPLVLGLGIRVYITRFAPVTNMYGTMIWVALGVMVFSSILYKLYQSSKMSGMMYIGAGLILLLTDSIPLILSPDLDPIVAVLRSNFWLSTHVTTITISYAAFTIAMILGNVTLVRIWLVKDNSAFVKEYSHYAYRMIQLGCFLLTVGIILGGVWADYSWGRFWGWDPKETWALIADLGFLALLHARYIGWLDPFKLLAFSPLSYLLVVMAWYGVNFILAAGLHSYGFSSGGATAVAIFVSLQVVLLVAGIIRVRQLKMADAIA